MISNYVSAIKACFVLYDLPFHILDHPKIKYFQKSVKINLISHNIIDLDSLEKISAACHDFTCGQVLRAVFLTVFGGFFRLSNLAPHSLVGILLARTFSLPESWLKYLLNGSKPFTPEMLFR